MCVRCSAVQRQITGRARLPECRDSGRVHVEHGGDQRERILDDGHRDGVRQAVVGARGVLSVEHGSVGDYPRDQSCGGHNNTDTDERRGTRQHSNVHATHSRARMCTYQRR
jgi:hypothetical protein